MRLIVRDEPRAFLAGQLDIVAFDLGRVDDGLRHICNHLRARQLHGLVLIAQCLERGEQVVAKILNLVLNGPSPIQIWRIRQIA